MGKCQNARMKHSILTAALIYLVVSAGPAYASQVFKCTNEDGVATFAFAPCAASQPSVSSEPDRLSVEDTMDQIGDIDTNIARLNRKFRDLRLSHEENLRDEANKDSKNSLRQIYSTETGALLESLSSLKADRERLVNGTIEQLAGSE